ncbi:MAG: radical SAM/SPASM domain-containing protein [Deltaproteobacteria bacterium]|nr:radical SAM/SPASM domain-containing protein [Deltaproteobacteria bacterium]
MFSLLVNTYCNGACPYCFAKSSMNGKQLDLSNLDLLVRVYKKYNQKVAGVFGGEPTLHPDFLDIIQKFSQNELLPVVYSNALMEAEILAELAKTEIRMVLNINTRDVYSNEKYELLLKNLHVLSQTLGRKVRIGVNFYKPGQDIESILDILKTTNFDYHVRIGLASPILDETNSYAREEDFPQLGHEIYEFIKKILARGYIPFFDCGIRLCMFNESQLEDIRYDIAGSISHSACYRMFTIFPDLTISPCITLADYIKKLNLEETTNFKKIYQFYESTFAKYTALGNLEKCRKCHYFQKICTGGCLSRTIINHRHVEVQEEFDFG